MADARIESFLADVLALEGEDPDAIRDGVRVALADCGEIYRAQEVKQTHEGQSSPRLPRPLPRSDHRRNAASEGSGDRRAFEVRSERY